MYNVYTNTLYSCVLTFDNRAQRKAVLVFYTNIVYINLSTYIIVSLSHIPNGSTNKDI